MMGEIFEERTVTARKDYKGGKRMRVKTSRKVYGPRGQLVLDKGEEYEVEDTVCSAANDMSFYILKDLPGQIFYTGYFKEVEE